jgi:methionine-rich copper-binding protein CopC
MRKLVVALAAAAFGLLPAAAGLAVAHAAPVYVTSDPPNGATVDRPPSRVSVTFSEPLDSTSTLRVFDECGLAVDSGDDQVLGSRIEVGIADTPSGDYTAVYVATGFGGATGETKGSFTFHVTSGEPCGGGHGGHGGHGGEGGGLGGGGHGGGGGRGGHGGHDGGDRDHPGGDSGHTAHEGGGSGHEGRGHGGSAGGAAHGDGHDENGHDGHHEDRGAARGGSPADGGLPDLSSGRGGPGLAPTSTSVVIALALSIALGALGGWVLRVSAGS